MTKTLIAIIALAIGVGGTMTLGGGLLVGLGAATGLSTGICSTVQAAQEEGLLTADQVDQVLNRAAQDLAATVEPPAKEEMVGSAAACEKVLARLRTAQ